MTAHGFGLIKTDGEGLLFAEGDTGMYHGKRYCKEHLRFVASQDDFKYPFKIGE